MRAEVRHYDGRVQALRDVVGELTAVRGRERVRVQERYHWLLLLMQSVIARPGEVSRAWPKERTLRVTFDRKDAWTPFSVQNTLRASPTPRPMRLPLDALRLMAAISAHGPCLRKASRPWAGYR